MEPGGVGGAISAKGLMTADVNGNFKLTAKGNPRATSVTFTLDPDCTVELEIALPSEHGETITPMKLRGILTNGGKQILAIQTDPGAMVSAKFTAP